MYWIYGLNRFYVGKVYVVGMKDGKVDEVM